MPRERSSTQCATSRSSGVNETRKCRQRSFWRLAKRLVISSKTREPSTSATVPEKSCAEDETTSDGQQLQAPVLLSVFEYLPLLDRIRLRMACKLTDFIYGSIPVSLPPIKFQSVNEDDLLIFSENSDFIMHQLIPEIGEHEVHRDEDSILMKTWHAQLLMQRIAQRIDRIEHLWLESTVNGLLCTTLLNEVEDDNGRKCYRRRKLVLEKLTVIGTKTTVLPQISDFIAHFSPTLEQLRLRHMRMDSDSLSQEFWSAVDKCSHLRQFQYETCRYDRFSHIYMTSALCGKEITTLELSGIYEFSSSNLALLTKGRLMKNLSILCPKVKLSSYLMDGIVESVEHVDTLLFQCGTSFALDDVEERKTVECVLRKMKDDAKLEVLHDVGNRVAHAARTISYWLQLSRETDRTIMLKLSDISQEKIDQAVGRIFRKCENVFKAASNYTALVLTRGIGRVHLLDNNTWFGEDDDDIISY